MACTATVYARIEPKLKEEVDEILSELGVTPSSLIQMLYNQIRLTNSIPFDIKLPKKPVCIDNLTKDEFRIEVQKGISDVDNGNVKNSEEVDLLLKEKLGI